MFGNVWFLSDFNIESVIKKLIKNKIKQMKVKFKRNRETEK